MKIKSSFICESPWLSSQKHMETHLFSFLQIDFNGMLVIKPKHNQEKIILIDVVHERMVSILHP